MPTTLDRVVFVTLDAAQRRELVAMWNRGASLPEIMAYFGISRAVIMPILYKAGVTYQDVQVRRWQNAQAKAYDRVCEHCGETFTCYSANHASTCSRECRKALERIKAGTPTLSPEQRKRQIAIVLRQSAKQAVAEHLNFSRRVKLQKEIRQHNDREADRAAQQMRDRFK